MSRAIGAVEVVAETLRKRLDAGLHRIAFFIVPSSMAFIALGDIIAAALYQTGRFTASDSRYVWAILAGASVGLLASTMGRLYSSTYYVLNDTRTALKFAIVRVSLATVLGSFCSIYLPRLIGVETKWGVVGLTTASGICGWVEFALLRRTLNRRIGRTGLSPSYIGKLWLGAGAGAAVGWAFKWLLGHQHPLIMAAVVLGGYGLTYFAATSLLGIGESKRVIERILRVARISS